MTSRTVESARILGAIAELQAHLKSSKELLLDLSNMSPADPDLLELLSMSMQADDLVQDCAVALTARAAGAQALTLRSHELSAVQAASHVSQSISRYLSDRAVTGRLSIH